MMVVVVWQWYGRQDQVTPTPLALEVPVAQAGSLVGPTSRLLLLVIVLSNMVVVMVEYLYYHYQYQQNQKSILLLLFLVSLQLQYCQCQCCYCQCYVVLALIVVLVAAILVSLINQHIITICIRMCESIFQNQSRRRLFCSLQCLLQSVQYTCTNIDVWKKAVGLLRISGDAATSDVGLGVLYCYRLLVIASCVWIVYAYSTHWVASCISILTHSYSLILLFYYLYCTICICKQAYLLILLFTYLWLIV